MSNHKRLNVKLPQTMHLSFMPGYLYKLVSKSKFSVFYINLLIANSDFYILPWECVNTSTQRQGKNISVS